jgi:hypothetical protein
MGDAPPKSVDRVITDYYERAHEGVYGIEGPGWVLPDVAERMGDAQRRETLLRVARMLETEPAVLGSSAHLLAVAQRPN